MFQGADDLLAYIKDEGVETVDVRFCDLPGVMQHFTVPAQFFDADVFENGLSFDGSSIRGFQKIHESDMTLMPDPSTAFIDPFRKAKTLAVSFFVHDPLTKEAYSRDPRNIARKAENYLASTGIGDAAYMGPEAEFYVFDSVRYETKANAGFYYIDSEAGAWNTGAEADTDGRGNRGYKVKYKGGYFPVAPLDHFADLRDDMVRNLIASGLVIERAHHEVGTAGQGEIATKFDSMLTAADNLMKYKYIVKNTAWAAGKTATFMPKPIFGDNGSGMHVHQSLWKDGQTLMYEEGGYANLSQTAAHVLGRFVLRRNRIPEIEAAPCPDGTLCERFGSLHQHLFAHAFTSLCNSIATSGHTTAHQPQLVHFAWSVHSAGRNPRAFSLSLIMRILTGQTLTHRLQLLHRPSSIETRSKTGLLVLRIPCVTLPYPEYG